MESCKVYLSQVTINLGSKSAKLSLKHLGETVFQVTGKLSSAELRQKKRENALPHKAPRWQVCLSARRKRCLTLGTSAGASSGEA